MSCRHELFFVVDLWSLACRGGGIHLGLQHVVGCHSVVSPAPSAGTRAITAPTAPARQGREEDTQEVRSHCSCSALESEIDSVSCNVIFSSIVTSLQYLPLFLLLPHFFPLVNSIQGLLHSAFVHLFTRFEVPDFSSSMVPQNSHSSVSFA